MPQGRLDKTKDIGAKLTALNIQQEERLASRRAEILHLPYIDLFAFPFESGVLEAIPRTEAQAAGAVLFYKKGKDLRMGVVNPQADAFDGLVEKVEKKFGLKPQVYIISHHSLKTAIARYQREEAYVPLDTDTISISQEQLDQFQEALDSYEKLGQRISSVVPSELMSSIMAGAVKMGASDVHIEPRRDEAQLRYRIDGVLQNVATFGLSGWKHLLSRLKVVSDLKLNVHHMPQEGGFVMHAGDTKYDIRISILPGGLGEYIVLRLLNRKEGALSLDQLGMKARDKEVVEEALKESTGLILSAGPTGSGKTTTIVSCLAVVNRPEFKIITLEDPIEYRVVGAEQTEVDASAGYTFPVGLRSILRQDPDIIFVGEMRDSETAETGIHAAMTGHLVFSTIHSNDAPGVILRLVGMGLMPYVLAPAIDLIIAQRLVRLVCKKCSEEYKVDKKTKEHISNVMEGVDRSVFDPAILADPNLTFFKTTGCKDCGNTGYRGRVGAFEILVVKGELEEMVLQGADAASLREVAQEHGMTTIRQDAYLKVISKLTTIEEVERISEE
jgi:type IV pilus assembly protein PilB